MPGAFIKKRIIKALYTLPFAFLLAVLHPRQDVRAAGFDALAVPPFEEETKQDAMDADSDPLEESGQAPPLETLAGPETEELENIRYLYQTYQIRFEAVENRTDISEHGFSIVESQIFPIALDGYEEALMIPAFDAQYHRLALFFASQSGQILYKTDQLETNSRVRGQMEQPNTGIAAVAFQDLNGDGRMDIVLITSCMNDSGSYAGKPYKVGDVLFQSGEGPGFYRDYRIADKINRFGMNKSAESIIAFVRDGYSTEFLYTSTMLEELLQRDFQIIAEQCHVRTFGKLGRLQVVPGIYRIADYDIFLIYLVNEDGYIVSSLQPMGEYDNLYALKGIQCRDIDGDGLKDIVVLARYSKEGEAGQLLVESDYRIYYQRTGGFSADTELNGEYQCSDEDTMETLVQKARHYWGWKTEND